MVTLKKANRVITVDDKFLNSYLIRGYDQIDSTGKVIKRATGGKVVQVGEFNKLVVENKDLQDRIKELVKKNNELIIYIKQLEEDNEKLTRQIKLKKNK